MMQKSEETFYAFAKILPQILQKKMQSFCKEFDELSEF